MDWKLSNTAHWHLPTGTQRGHSSLGYPVRLSFRATTTTRPMSKASSTSSGQPEASRRRGGGGVGSPGPRRGSVTCRWRARRRLRGLARHRRRGARDLAVLAVQRPVLLLLRVPALAVPAVVAGDRQAPSPAVGLEERCGPSPPRQANGRPAVAREQAPSGADGVFD